MGVGLLGREIWTRVSKTGKGGASSDQNQVYLIADSSTTRRITRKVKLVSGAHFTGDLITFRQLASHSKNKMTGGPQTQFIQFADSARRLKSEKLHSFEKILVQKKTKI